MEVAGEQNGSRVALADDRELLQGCRPTLVWRQLAPFPSRETVDEACQRVMAFLVNTSIAGQSDRVSVAGKVSVESFTAPLGLVVAHDSLIIVS